MFLNFVLFCFSRFILASLIFELPFSVANYDFSFFSLLTIICFPKLYISSPCVSISLCIQNR